MKNKTKIETDSLLRIPKARKLGLRVPQIAMPHDDLISPEKPHLEIVPTLPSQTTQTTQTRQSDVAPTKNFQKVANSISKQAVPDGWFSGKSKQLYDALYTLTRGAINPTRTVRIRKGKLMKLAAIGARNTFDRNIQLLINTGLIIETVCAGEHEGNEFEVFLPDEISLPSLPSLPTMTRQTRQSQKLDRLLILETRQTRQSLNPIDTDVSNTPKTSLKTNTSDDEAFRPLIEKLSSAAERITGKKPTARDAQNWSNLADLLILQLDAAARKTNDISNVPAFLTEVCRRKFLNVSSAPKSKAKVDTVGKSEPESYEIKPLDEKGREAALEQLQEFAGSPFLQDFEKWYVAEDWKWISENLK